MHYENGVAADQIKDAVWLKSTASQGAGNCVEVSGLPDGRVALRNSRHPGGPALVYSRDELAAFVAGARNGEFDELSA
ncbi:DUF397 domain-containing protein [Streptomyces sp. NPDC088747]|uniref:DUF397 domain-containing protein n=1 Tax=Streptomyces sp. NPDC088747 TaxID=3365886 RepID=UPI0037F6D6B3